MADIPNEPTNLVFCRGSKCAIFMYDTTKLSSFEKIPKSIEALVSSPEGSCLRSVFIVGNKIKEKGRVVTEEMAADLCYILGDNYYFSFVDVKHCINIDECVNNILRTIINGEVLVERRDRKSVV